MVKKFIKNLIGERMLARIRKWRRLRRSTEIAAPYFRYDNERLLNHSGIFCRDTRESRLAQLIASYHVVEKGLTMPNRRFTFGAGAIRETIRLADLFEKRYGKDEPQLLQAIGVVKAYLELHKSNGIVDKEGDPGFFAEVEAFAKRHEDVPAAKQIHVTREGYFANLGAAFPEFAASRRTVRHYAGKELPLERIENAVKIALTTPTACNRQHCRVYCISDREKMKALLDIQKGNRGFGHLADKLLVVTSDLDALQGIAERNDAYVNGGLFLMNLCYALHWEKIVHCILNWSRKPEEDEAMRKLLPIRESEVVIAILTCGEAPEEFEIASSPRNGLESVFVNLG